MHVVHSSHWRAKETRAEQLRLLLLAAVSGATAVSISCAGRSVDDDRRGDAGETSAAGTVGSNGGSSGSANGGSAGSSSGSGGTVQEPVGRPPHGCVAQPLWPDSTNLEACTGDFVHRTSNAACPLPAREGMPDGGTGENPIGSCTTDADCVAAAHGYCTEYFGPGRYTQCVYACETNADCAPGKVCSCEGNYSHASDSAPLMIGRCADADCTSDAECGEGLLCIAQLDTVTACGPPRPGHYRCQTPEDRCSGASDCGGGYVRCLHQDERFACVQQSGTGGSCGRPFLVFGRARTAELAPSCDWSDVSALPSCPDLPASALTRITQHYLGAALMEHASIAAFARFSLQLLALGAPASLLEASARAVADETRHARLCFALAARYGGSSLAPGPLDVSGALDEVELLDVVRLVIDEGCVGESVAALAAHAAADLASDPAVKRLLSGIAEDETRHAELAFRFVAWAAGRDARVERVVRERLAALLTETESALPAVAPIPPLEEFEALLAHGVLDAAAQQFVRSTALENVVIPALRSVARRQRAETGRVRAVG